MEIAMKEPEKTIMTAMTSEEICKVSTEKIRKKKEIYNISVTPKL
jgi:hypothetical protein